MDKRDKQIRMKYLRQQIKDHVYHVTGSENVPSIGEKGLVPNFGNKQKKWGDNLQKNSKGKNFFFPDDPTKKQYYQTFMGDMVSDTARSFSKRRAAAILRVPVKRLQGRLEPDERALSGLVVRRPQKAENIEMFHKDSGWFNIGAHAPEELEKMVNKAKPEDFNPSAKRKSGEQLSLFPTSMYTEAVNQIVDRLLGE